MPLFRQRLTDKDYKEFKDEISEVLNSAFRTHGLPLTRVWVPCVLNHTCVVGQLGHVNSVSILDRRLNNSLDPSLFYFNLVCSFVHLKKGKGIIGKAFLTNQAFLSTNIASSSNTEERLSYKARMYGLRTASVAIPLRSSIHNSECVLECLLPFNCRDFGEQKKILFSLFSTLIQCCKTLRVVADRIVEEKSGFPFLSFEALQPFNMVLQSVANRSLIPKEYRREAHPKHVMQLLSKSIDQNETSPDPTLRIRPAKVCDARDQDGISMWSDLLQRLETNPKRVMQLLPESTDPNKKCPDSTPIIEPADFWNRKSSAVAGRSTGGAGSKRDWAWKYCSSIPGNSNGVICSFCDIEIKGGGITRFKSHISGSDPSKNVKKCENVPPEVKAEIDQKGKKRR